MISKNIKCFFINLKSVLRLKKHRVHPYKDLYKVTDDNDTMYIARLNRHNRSKKKHHERYRYACKRILFR